MNETPIVIVGNVATDPVMRRVGEQSVLRFRVASNSRRRTADGSWDNGNTLYASVSCWGRLAEGAAASLRKGDPVIVTGQVYTSEYDDRDGNPRSSVEVRASAVGPDLARCIARVDKIQRRTEDQPDQVPEPADDDTVTVEAVGTVDDLPLTA
jgi:single-strand DNA-binding protein